MPTAIPAHPRNLQPVSNHHAPSRRRADAPIAMRTAELPRALGDRIGHHAVETDRRPEKRQPAAKGHEQQHREPAECHRVVHDLLERANR